MAYIILIIFLIWSALLMASNSITLLKGRRVPNVMSFDFAQGQCFPYSKHLARQMMVRPQKLLLLLVFYVLSVFLLWISTLVKSDLITDTTSYFTTPLLIMMMFSFITSPAILAVTLGDTKHLKLHKLYVDREGFITYFHIGERRRSESNPLYIFYQDRITRISHMEEYAYYTKLICDVERTIFKHQDTHLSEDGIQPTGETCLAADQMLWIPHVFEGFR